MGLWPRIFAEDNKIDFNKMKNCQIFLKEFLSRPSYISNRSRKLFCISRFYDKNRRLEIEVGAIVNNKAT